LTDLGHQVDLVTYHLGEDVQLDGLTIHRIPAVRLIKRISIGPSFSKIVLDILVFFKALSLLLKKRYHLIHTHEEAAFMGVIFRWLYRIPHLYDMHSDLSQQMENFQVTHSKFIVGLVRCGERWVINHSDFIIGICPTLGQTIQSLNTFASCSVIENSPLAYDPESFQPEIEQHIDSLLGPDAVNTILYTGTLEIYQGLDLLFEAAQRVTAERNDVRFILVGGSPKQVSIVREHLTKLGLSPFFNLIGQRPPEEIPYFLKKATILVSPRKSGTNTPLKIYSYLASGKPVLATDLLTHTQVLDPETALLVPPQGEAFAEGILKLLDDQGLRVRLAEAAQLKYQQEYAYEKYISKVSRAVETTMENWEKRKKMETDKHYATRLYRQKNFARSFDDHRFGTVFGQYLSDLEIATFNGFIPHPRGKSILDAGGGTGRLALPLVNDGAEVTIIDTSIEMMAIAREKADAFPDKIFLACGSVEELPFRDCAFDWLISSRVIMHVRNWRNALSEFCRVAQEGVIFDFPPLIGFPALAVPFLKLKKFFSIKTQHYMVIYLNKVISELEHHGFTVYKIERRFFLPVGFYRKINNPVITAQLERIFRALHLTNFFGAPVTICAKRTLADPREIKAKS